MKPFCAADILLPDESVNLEQWAALACDQFTSRPEYWKEAEALCQDSPSTLHITLPEVYLGAPDERQRIADIHRTMEEYWKTVLTRTVHGFVYVERTTESGVRQGAVRLSFGRSAAGASVGKHGGRAYSAPSGGAPGRGAGNAPHSDAHG